MAELQERNLTINYACHDQAEIGALRMIIELDGQIITRVNPHIGFFHRGLEKLLEAHTYFQAPTFFAHLDSAAPGLGGHCFCRAVETLMSVEVPRRAQLIRVLYCELSRIFSHLFNLAAQSSAVGASLARHRCLEVRRDLKALLDSFPGSGLGQGEFCVGGLAEDLDEAVLGGIKDWRVVFLKQLPLLDRLLTENRVFKQRLVDIGVLRLEDCWGRGMSGPVLRACGVAWDLRKSQPYECYDEMDFDIPVGKHGDAYDRHLVRMAEMRQSVRIIEQCLEKLAEPEGQGAFLAEELKGLDSDNPDLDHQEALRRHFALFGEGYCVPEGQVYCSVESPKGEFGIYLVSDGSARPFKCKIRSASFAHLAMMHTICQNYQLADIPVILASLDIAFGEVDR